MPGIATNVNVYLLADELSDRYIDYKSCRLRKPLPFISEFLDCDSSMILDAFSAVADFRHTEPLAKTGEYGIGFPSWNCAIVTTNARVETTLLVMFHPGFECIGVMTNDQFIGLVSARKEIETAVENLQKAVCPEYQAPPH